MKQTTLSMIPLLCAAVAPLCADTQGMNGKKQTSAEQQQMYMQEMNKITPSAEPSVNRVADPFVSADFIWWRVQEDGLEYAFTGAGNGVTSASKGRLYHPSFKYEPGFKVGAGLKFRHDGWDLYGQYTWLHTRGANSVTSGDGSLLNSNIFVPVDGTMETSILASASANWKVKLNVLDLELGRNFWISKWLTLRPYTGVKFSWNNQHLTANYNGFEPAPILGDDVNLSMKINQFGVGVRSGLDTAWYMWKRWSIFGEFAATGMLNYFDSTRKDTDTVTGVVINNLTKISQHRVTAILEWALGLRYETAWHNDDYMFTIQAGWEEQIWFNQNQFIFMPNAAANDLNFEGLQLKVAFNF